MSISVIHILPELEQGGVEDHVTALACAQAASGLSVTVVSGGGRLTSQLDGRVRHIELPVGRKNIVTGLSCARKIAREARSAGAQILHAHSRVPGWIAYFAGRMYSAVKTVYTVHAMFSKNLGTWPIGRMDGAICVSRAVRDDLQYRLLSVPKVRVVYNALTKEIVPWRGSGGPVRRLAFAGRLTSFKNLETVLAALAPLKDRDWTLDVWGDGDKRAEYEDIARGAGIDSKVTFHGFASDVPSRLAACDLFLFPSRNKDGLSLMLGEVLTAGVPTIASDTDSAREITSGDVLLPPDDAAAWTRTIERYLDGVYSPALRLEAHLPTLAEHERLIADVYEDVLAAR